MHYAHYAIFHFWLHSLMVFHIIIFSVIFKCYLQNSTTARSRQHRFQPMATLVESALRGKLCLGTTPDWPLLLIFFHSKMAWQPTLHYSQPSPSRYRCQYHMPVMILSTSPSPSTLNGRGSGWWKTRCIPSRICRSTTFRQSTWCAK